MGSERKKAVPRRGKTEYSKRLRRERREEFLRVAREIVSTEGLQALSMQRVTRTVGSSEGGIYLYFASKSALVAALEVESLQAIARSFVRGQEQLRAVVQRSEAPAKVQVLAAALGLASFWTASEQTLPTEIELSRSVLSRPTTISDPEHVAQVLPATLAILQLGRQCLDDAVDAGVLVAGDNVRRTLIVVSSVNGTLLTSKLGGWDSQLFEGRQLADEVSTALFASWGADRKRLGAAQALLAGLDPEVIAPVVDGDDETQGG